MFSRMNRLADWAVSRAVAHMQQPSNAAQYATELVKLRAKLEEERRAAGERIADLEARLEVSRGRASVLAADLRNSNRLAERLGRKVKTKNRILSERAAAMAALEERLMLVETDRETAAGLMLKLALVEEERDTAKLQRDAALAEAFELESKLASRANLRPKRETPEGWSVERSSGGLNVYQKNVHTAYATRAEALALAAYLDSEEPTQCP